MTKDKKKWIKIFKKQIKSIKNDLDNKEITKNDYILLNDIIHFKLNQIIKTK